MGLTIGYLTVIVILGIANIFFWTVRVNKGENNKNRGMPKKNEGQCSGRIGSEEAKKAYDGPKSIDSWLAQKLQESWLVQDIKREPDVSGVGYWQMKFGTCSVVWGLRVG